MSDRFLKVEICRSSFLPAGNLRKITGLVLSVIFAMGLCQSMKCGSSTQANDDNSPPVIESITPERYSMAAGDMISISSSAWDPDGDELTWIWAPSGGYILTSGESVTYLSCSCSTGTNKITLMVMDEHDATAQVSVFIDVYSVAP